MTHKVFFQNTSHFYNQADIVVNVLGKNLQRRILKDLLIICQSFQKIIVNPSRQCPVISDMQHIFFKPLSVDLIFRHALRYKLVTLCPIGNLNDPRLLPLYTVYPQSLQSTHFLLLTNIDVSIGSARFFFLK